MIPPDEDEAFVAAMEQVLEVYQRPEDPKIRLSRWMNVLCSCSKTSGLLCLPNPDASHAETTSKARCCRFCFLIYQPREAWRRVSVRERRTAIDWAEEVKYLLDEVYPEAPRVTLVCDNLNTHKITSLYKAFPADEALGLSSRLELVHTPKHGSWLNIAEIELSVFSRQCLNRRIPDLQTLRSEVEAWQKHRNENAGRVDWRFTTDNARIKLKRLYPKTQS